MKNIAKGLLVLLATALIASCGGGGGGGLTGQNPLVVTITAGDTSLPTNVLQVSPCVPGQCPYTTSVIVTVMRPDGSIVPNGTTVQLSTNNVAVGTLTKLDDPETEDVNEFQLRMGTLNATTQSGQAQFFFTTNTTGGTATLTASVANEKDGKVVTAQIHITVVDTTGPVSKLTFTGPYAEAIVTGKFSLGDTELQDGTYSRVLSVIAKDANGNPVRIGTPIYFALIDSPLTGFPSSGAGTFTLTGTNGDPVEGGFVFTAAGGAFESKGARAGDRLVLHPDPEGENWFHEGVRVIGSFNSADSLNITTGNGPFASGGDTGATVPWTIGRAQYGTILATAVTDLTGTASTVVTYPATRIGQTAILVAYTADHSVSTVLNNGNPVYLADAGAGGTGLVLTADTTTLAFNSGGSDTLTLCIKDPTFGTPVPGATITWTSNEVPSNGGTTTTLLNGGVAIITGINGCATFTVTGTYVADGDNNATTNDTGRSVVTFSFTSTPVITPAIVTLTITDNT